MDSREMCTTAVSRAFQSEENRPSTAMPNIYKNIYDKKNESLAQSTNNNYMSGFFPCREWVGVIRAEFVTTSIDFLPTSKLH